MTPIEEKKYLKIGGIVAGSLLVLYLLFKKPAENGGTFDDPTGNNGNGSGSGNNAPVFNAKSTAENLFLLMDIYGTKEDEIVAELTNVTQSQFAQVVTAFGKKPYFLFGSNDWFGTPQGLKYWLQEELGVTSSYYRTLKLKYPLYL
jgi:hypothetical protein